MGFELVYIVLIGVLLALVLAITSPWWVKKITKWAKSVAKRIRQAGLELEDQTPKEEGK